MSELDADLYGGQYIFMHTKILPNPKSNSDLYGDDNEFTVPLEDPKEDTSVKFEQKQVSPPPQKTQIENNPVQSSSPTINNAQQDSSSSNTFSQIPTYSSSMSDQYGGHRPHSGQPRLQSYDDYQPISTSYSGGDRSVRPSEMKEEG